MQFKVGNLVEVISDDYKFTKIGCKGIIRTIGKFEVCIEITDTGVNNVCCIVKDLWKVRVTDVRLVNLTTLQKEINDIETMGYRYNKKDDLPF